MLYNATNIKIIFDKKKTLEGLLSKKTQNQTVKLPGKDIIVLEAFVFAPRYDKRQYLRQVESLLYSFEWKKDEK